MMIEIEELWKMIEFDSDPGGARVAVSRIRTVVAHVRVLMSFVSNQAEDELHQDVINWFTEMPCECPVNDKTKWPGVLVMVGLRMIVNDRHGLRQLGINRCCRFQVATRCSKFWEGFMQRTDMQYSQLGGVDSICTHVFSKQAKNLFGRLLSTYILSLKDSSIHHHFDNEQTHDSSSKFLRLQPKSRKPHARNNVPLDDTSDDNGSRRRWNIISQQARNNFSLDANGSRRRWNTISRG
ncbi:hypothetical protein C5167_041840 [Papaver somniferum]|nr:hypothetical protein C5167_041840 [Papaver somniferum]